MVNKCFIVYFLSFNRNFLCLSDVCFFLITEEDKQDVEEEIKVKCPCGNDEVCVCLKILAISQEEKELFFVTTTGVNETLAQDIWLISSTSV